MAILWFLIRLRIALSYAGIVVLSRLFFVNINIPEINNSTPETLYTEKYIAFLLQL